MESFDYDIEKDMWEEVRWVSCELEHSFKSMKGIDGICTKATDYYEGMYLHNVPSLEQEHPGSSVEEEKPSPKAESKPAPTGEKQPATEEKPTGFKSKPPGPGA